MAVGYIDPPPKERVRPPRKQVIVVVTASWQVRGRGPPRLWGPAKWGC